MSRPLTVLCIASYEKGHEFMRQCKREGCTTLLLTSKSLEDVEWPRESLDDIFFMPDNNKQWNLLDMIHAVSFLARSVQIDRIVALDDFDVEKAAALREHLRIPGMGDTTSRYFRDKLAMRMQAADRNLPEPRFVPVINYDQIREYLAAVPAPYVLKPRSQASAVGIKKIPDAETLWRTLDTLGDRQSYYVLEEFVKGPIFHVDAIVNDRKVLFSSVSRYGTPPMEVMHEGRVFTTRTVKYGSKEEKALNALNKAVMEAFGLKRGVSHSEYIQGADGKFYFLETGARVGGANIVDLVEGATGLNLWAEWAKLETATAEKPYAVPTCRKEYGGLLVSLAKQEWPDLSSYDAPEVFWRMSKHHHAGLVLRSPDSKRIETLLAEYEQRFYTDFFTALPPPEKITD